MQPLPLAAMVSLASHCALLREVQDGLPSFTEKSQDDSQTK